MLSSPCKARWAWSSRRQQPLIHGQRRHVYGSKSCEGAPRTAASYALFHRVMGLFGSVAKNSGLWIAILGFRSSPPQAPIHACSLLDASASQAFYTRPWKHWWGFLRHLARPPPIPQPNAGGGVPLGFVNGCTLLDSSQRVTTALCAMRSISPATGGPHCYSFKPG